MTAKLTAVLIRPFLNFFSANALLLMFSRLRWSHSILHPQVWQRLKDFRLWSLVASLTLIGWFCGTTWCGSWGRPCIWIASCTVNSCSPPRCSEFDCGCSFAPPAPPKLGTSRCCRSRWYWAWRWPHCLCCLPYLTWRDIPPMYPSPLLHSPPPCFCRQGPRSSSRYLQQFFPSQDSFLKLAKVLAGKASARLPSKQYFIGGASDSSDFQLFWNLLGAGKGGQNGFGERSISY